MPKDTLKQLDRDVDRMLFAGAQIARTDPGLTAAKEKLKPLAARAPALGKVSEQIEKLHQSSGKGSATELLGLAMLMAQVRGAQAAPALPESTEPLGTLKPAPKVGTPLSPTELSMLVAALLGTPEARYRQRTIVDFAERGAAKDLRILPLCVPALQDGSIADVVEQVLLPALGEAIVPELRGALDFEKNRALDVRLLRAIARLEKQNAADVCCEALEKGGADLRAAAIEELGRIAPEVAEPLALSLLDKDRSKEVRAAAVRALAKATSDEALEAMLRAFQGTPEMRQSADGVLGQSKHPKATERILALFTPELLDLGHFKVKRATTKTEKDEAAKAQKAHENTIDYLVDLVDLAASRGGDETAEVLLRIFRTHKVKEVRDAAGRALLRIGYAGAWHELLPSLLEATGEAQEEFVRGVIALDPEIAFEKLSRFFEPAALQSKHGLSLAARILLGARGDEVSAEGIAQAPLVKRDPRWVDLAVDHCHAVDLRFAAIALLLQSDSPRTLEAGLSLSREEGLAPVACLPTMQLLAKHKDPRVLPAFIRCIERLRSTAEIAQALDVLTKYDDPKLAPLIRSYLDARQSKKKMSRAEMIPFDECLRMLERDRSADPALGSAPSA